MLFRSPVYFGLILLSVNGATIDLIYSCLSKILPEDIEGTGYGITYSSLNISIFLFTFLEGIIKDYFENDNSINTCLN